MIPIDGSNRPSCAALLAMEVSTVDLRRKALKAARAKGNKPRQKHCKEKEKGLRLFRAAIASGTLTTNQGAHKLLMAR